MSKRFTEIETAIWLNFKVVVGMLLCQPVYSQGQNRNDDDIVRVRTRVVFVDTLVQDKKTGAPIADLARESFQVLADGKVRTLSYFSRCRCEVSTGQAVDMPIQFGMSVY